jgi:RNA polymerase sigma factor (sigma-70 family)
MEPSDAALVLACRKGDAAAWEALINRYQRLVYSIPRRSGLSEELAADVFQQVFTILYEKLALIEQPDRISAWLVTTARRETWRLSRQDRAMQPLTTSGADEGEDALDPPDNETLPEELLLRLERQQHIRTAVASLDERCRTLLTLLFYQPDPPPYAEIATRLGTTEGSIGPTRARCFEKLRRLLDEFGI